MSISKTEATDISLATSIHFWKEKRNRQLPSPCPQDSFECAKWWRVKMQKPEKQFEDSVVKASYTLRLRLTILKFLDLQEIDRDYIIAARKDKVFWSGEPIETFKRYYNETMEKRDQASTDYRRMLVDRIQKQLGLAESWT